MALLQRVAQDPSFVTRQAAVLGATAAGASGTSAKFVAHAALLLFSVTGAQLVLSTSTYGGTASNMQVNVIVVQNTSTTSAPALSTTTIGPFTMGGTATSSINVANQYALNTTTGTQGQGGLPVVAGAVIWAQNGTDTTATCAVTIDYQIASQAPLTV
jgi:hypothetical protein